MPRPGLLLGLVVSLLGTGAGSDGADPAASLDEGSTMSATLDETVWVGFRSMPARDDINDYISVDGRGLSVNRIAIDTGSGVFYGYQLTAKRLPDGRIRVEIGPIPPEFDPEGPVRPQCPRCPRFTPLSAALVRYPEPQVLKDGSSFTFELLRKPATGETLSDLVKIRLVPPRTGPTPSPISDRFRVEASIAPDPDLPGHARAEFRVFDLGAPADRRRDLQPALGPVLVTVEPGPKGGQLVFGGSSRSGRFVQARVEVKADIASATGTYSIELREGAELIHAERVTFPWPVR